jgi:uncharacterized membrane protein (DUF485 family)
MFRIEDGFQAWQRMEALEPPPPSKPWVLRSGFSDVQEVPSTGRPQVAPRLPGQNGELAAYSGLEPTPEDALKGARALLAGQLKALVSLELNYRGKAGVADERGRGLLEKAAARLLADPRFEADRYEEKLKLPASGSVAHRAAVLARVPDGWAYRTAEELIGAAQASERALEAERRSVGWVILSALILGLVVYFVYSFLNAGSKGHLAWPLRIASVAAYLLICLGLLFLRGRFP